MFLRFVVFNTALCQFVGAPNRGTLRRIKHIKAEAKEKTFRAELFFFFVALLHCSLPHFPSWICPRMWDNS